MVWSLFKLLMFCGKEITWYSCFVADCYQAAVNWVMPCIISGKCGKWISLTLPYILVYLYVCVCLFVLHKWVCVHVHDWIDLRSGNCTMHPRDHKWLRRWKLIDQGTWFSNKLQVYGALSNYNVNSSSSGLCVIFWFLVGWESQEEW